MFNATKTLALFPVLLIFGCATGPSGETYDSPIGKWLDTHETTLGSNKSERLTIVDDRSGTFPRGRIEFYDTSQEREWKAYWILENGRYECAEEKGGSKYWGVQVFRFNQDFNRYTGYWDSCGEGQQYGARGTR